MCLLLRNTVPPTETRQVYKIYERAGERYVSPYMYTFFIPENKEIVSDRMYAKATELEISYCTVNHGLHCFRLKKGVEEAYSYWNDTGIKYRVAVFNADPKDFTADGSFGKWDACVYHRLTFSHWLDEETSGQPPKTE